MAVFRSVPNKRPLSQSLYYGNGRSINTVRFSWPVGDRITGHPLSYEDYFAETALGW